MGLDYISQLPLQVGWHVIEFDQWDVGRSNVTHFWVWPTQSSDPPCSFSSLAARGWEGVSEELQDQRGQPSH